MKPALAVIFYLVVSFADTKKEGLKMFFECKCTMTQSSLGDGCKKCNTKLAIESMLTPEELADELINDAFFTDAQANYVAEEIYQPLLSLMATLNEKIDEIAKAI